MLAFIAIAVIVIAIVGGVWWFWPAIESKQREVQKEVGAAIKDQVNKL